MLSVIVPALDAARTLPATLASARAADECVVVDGGSSDATIAVALAGGARLVSAPPGRGGQLAAGVAAAHGDWLLLLHADTRLGSGWCDATRRFIADHSDRAGYFRFVLDSPDPRARRLERLVAWRCRRFALPYGDQGLLISRSLLAAVGGIRPLPIMEDVDLVRRLGRGRLAGIDVAAVTSGTRWQHDGWYLRSARNLACLLLYRIGVPAALIVRVYR